MLRFLNESSEPELAKFGTLGGILPITFQTHGFVCFEMTSNGVIRMKLKPLHDRIIIEAAERETTTASGIILPDSAQEKPLRGTVIAVGPGKMLDSGKLATMEIAVGETVLYGKYAGTEVTVEGDDYIILRSDDVLAVVTGTEAKKKEKVGAK